jgi:hypothetical protein
MGPNATPTLGLYVASTFLGSKAEGRCQLGDTLATCPPTDFRNENPDIDVISHHDPVLSAKSSMNLQMCGRVNGPPTEPRVSPVSADLGLLHRAGIKADGGYS